MSIFCSSSLVSLSIHLHCVFATNKLFVCNKNRFVYFFCIYLTLSHGVPNDKLALFKMMRLQFNWLWYFDNGVIYTYSICACLFFFSIEVRKMFRYLLAVFHLSVVALWIDPLILCYTVVYIPKEKKRNE